MPTRGQIVTNPANGNIYEYVETSKDSNGERVILKETIKMKGPLVPKHIHVYQEETFEVISGKLTIWFEGKETILSKDEKITLPKSKPHNHYNNDDEAVTYIHTVSPALDFDFLMENLIGLAVDGEAKKGKFGLVQQLVSLKYLDSKFYLADIPIGVQKLLMNTIAPIARLFGYRAVYKKYSGIEK